jgi:hypothetical protein
VQPGDAAEPVLPCSHHGDGVRLHCGATYLTQMTAGSDLALRSRVPAHR